MTCNPTTIQLSSNRTTTINVTLSSDPGDGTDVSLQVDGLTFSQTVQTASSVAVFTVTARTAANYSLWDATIQVGTNLAVNATAQVVETNSEQTVGVTITDTSVSYCSPISGGGGGSGTVTSITAGSGLTGGTITASGTIAHQAQPASGTGPAFVKSVEIDSFGHVTSVTGETSAGAFRTATGTDDAANLVTGVVASARLPAVSDSYTGQIETAADKTYTIDPRVAAARTLTYFYGRSGAGTCTGKLYNGSDLVATLAITTTSSTATLDTNYTAVSENAALTLVVSLNASATDVVFAVEYTQ